MTGAAEDVPQLRAALEQQLGALPGGDYAAVFSDGEPVAIALPARSPDLVAAILPAIELAAGDAGFSIAADSNASPNDGSGLGSVHQELRSTIETFCEALSGVMYSCQAACSASTNRDLADLYKRVCDDYHSGAHWHID